MRHALGFYHALTITGLYALPDTDSSFDATNLDNFIPAMKHCIATHPILSVVIQGESTENPCFVQPKSLNLRNHLHLIDTLFPARDDIHGITRLTKEIHDQPFRNVDQQPPWKVFIVPLTDEEKPSPRVYIVFAYSHSHGDGKSGLEFHRTFLEGLRTANETYDQSHIYQISNLASLLPPPLEQAANLTITWRYLFLNLFGGYIPNIACRLFDFQPPVNIAHASMAWTGKVMSYDPSHFHTGSEVLLIKKELLNAVLKICRENDVKFTGFLNHLIAHILHRRISQDGDENTKKQTLLGQIVVDLRPMIPAYAKNENQMGNSVSALYVSCTQSRKSGKDTTACLTHDTTFWNDARRTTVQLAECASTLVDQPIGLLRYLDSFRPWFLGKLGKNRDSSYEISNAIVFDPMSQSLNDSHAGKENWDIERVLFSQPANVTGSPLSFQIVTRKDSDMIITLNWQLGVLGVSDEDAFVLGILDRIHDLLTEITGVV
jgi:hypothetical protein